MSSLFRKIEEPKYLFCQSSLAVSEQDHVAFFGDNGCFTAWLSWSADQEFLL